MLCTCVCVPLHLNPSHVPPLSRMGQQVSRSLARALPVLFWTSWLHWRGCQSSQPLWPHDVNKYSLPSRYYAPAVFFIIIPRTFALVICVSQLVADDAGQSTLIKFVHFSLIHSLQEFNTFIHTKFLFFFPRPCPTDWYSLQCHFHLGIIFVHLRPTLSGARLSTFKTTRSRDSRANPYSRGQTWPGY